MWVENDEVIWDMEDWCRFDDINIPLFKEAIELILKEINKKSITPKTLKSYVKKLNKKLDTQNSYVKYLAKYLTQFIKWEEDKEG